VFPKEKKVDQNMEQKEKNKMQGNLNIKFIIISFIKTIERDGNKEFSETIFKNLLSVLKKKSKKRPLPFLKEIIDRAKPFCEVKSVRISGTSYKVPIEIKPIRQKTLVLRWIVVNSLKKLKLPLLDCLIKELIDTYHLVSGTIKMCDDLHKTAEFNKIYIQFRY